MSANPKADAVDAYLDTVARLEPSLVSVDIFAVLASAAISLKRTADALGAVPDPQAQINEGFHRSIVEALVQQQARATDRIADALDRAFPAVVAQPQPDVWEGFVIVEYTIGPNNQILAARLRRRGAPVDLSTERTVEVAPR